MVTYANWRSILWLQVAMIGVSFILSLFFIPPSKVDRGLFKLNYTGLDAVAQFNPLPVFQCMRYPNISFTVSQVVDCRARRKETLIVFSI
jgi:hypothetical protein